MTLCSSKIYRLGIGVRLRARRIALGLTQTEVADALGVSAARIGAFERGEASVAADRLLALAQILRTQIIALLPVEPDPEATDRTPTPYELMARTEEGAALAEAFVRIQTPRLRRHLALLAEQLAIQDPKGGALARQK